MAGEQLQQQLDATTMALRNTLLQGVFAAMDALAMINPYELTEDEAVELSEGLRPLLPVLTKIITKAKLYKGIHLSFMIYHLVQIAGSPGCKR